MSFEIGPSFSGPPAPPAPAARPSDRNGASFEAALQSVADARAPRAPARVDRVDFGIPAMPPPAALDAVAAAAERVEELAHRNRELHFAKDEESGRIIVQVRDLATGAVIRTIPPSGALEALTTGRLEV